MSAIGVQSQINKDRAFWLSTIPTDVIHGNILCDTIIANAGFVSSFYSDNSEISSLKVSTLSQRNADVSGMYVSTIRGNTAFFSTMTLASDLSGGLGYVRFSVDASGVQVDGDPIRFDNLVYLTSTINIIQVSTLVDTDIFAQRGFFSSLSSGSFSSGKAYISTLLCDDLSGNYASFDTLFVSTLEALDISGVAASNWSQYPTLNSSIIFQPAYILSNVGNQLFFAGLELTDASGGGVDWSIFPAYSTVQMSNQSFTGVSTIGFQDGATLTSVTGNDLLYNGLPVQFGSTSNVSQWASYPAVSTINTNGFGITSPGNLNTTVTSNARLLAGSFSTVADQGLAVTTNSDINLTAQNGLKGRINLTANPGTAGLFGEINMVANGGTVAGVGTGGLVSITANTPLGTLCNATSAIKLSASGVNSYAGAVPPIGSLAGYNFIYGTGGVNICAGLPPVLPNVPLTTYLYGTAGVTTSSDLYVPNILPYWNGLTTPPDMLISGRYIAPNFAQVYVVLSNVKNLYMEGAADIYGVNSLFMSNGYLSNVSTIQMTQGNITGANNISGSGAISGFGSVQATGAGFQGLSVSTIAANGNVSFPVSTLTNQLTWNNAIGQSTYVQGELVTIGRIFGQQDGVLPNVSRIENFSSIQGGTVSTINLIVSTINGLPWDISGADPLGNSYSTLQVSSLFGVPTGLPGSGNPGSTIYVNSGFTFTGDAAGTPGQGGRYLSSLRTINSSSLTIRADDFFLTNPTTGVIRIGGGGAYDAKFVPYGIGTALSTIANITNEIQVSTLFGVFNGLPGTGNPGSTITINSGLSFTGDGAGTPGQGGRFLSSLRTINSSSLTIKADDLFIENPLTGVVRIGGGGAYDARFVKYGLGTALSTTAVLTSSIITDGSLEISGGIIPTNTIELADGNGINFDDFSQTVFTRLERRDIATSNMLAVTNNPGLASNNLNPLAVGELWLTGGADSYSQSVRIYPQFPYGNYQMDVIDENGTGLFTFSEGYYNPTGLNPGYVQDFYGVSTIVGYQGDGTYPNVVIQNGLTTSSLTISSINGFQFDPDVANTSQFSTLFVSSLNFSSAISYTSNTAYNFPIFIEHDAAGNTSNSGAAIAVRGHNFQVGQVLQQIEMGWRATGENYIASLWPGQNLEDLQIEASQTQMTNGFLSSFLNYQGHALQTSADLYVGQTLVSSTTVSTPILSISSINGNNAQPAFASYVQTSSMTLVANSTTLLAWDFNVANSNTSVSGYDLTLSNTGTYKVGVSLQFNNTSGSDETWFYFLKNYVGLSNSASVFNVQNNVESLEYVEIVDQFVGGDTLQFGLYTTATDVKLSTITGPLLVIPDSPAAILTCYKIV